MKGVFKQFIRNRLESAFADFAWYRRWVSGKWFRVVDIDRVLSYWQHGERPKGESLYVVATEEYHNGKRGLCWYR